MRRHGGTGDLEIVAMSSQSLQAAGAELKYKRWFDERALVAFVKEIRIALPFHGLRSTEEKPVCP